jgi:hypothetical protein
VPPALDESVQERGFEVRIDAVLNQPVIVPEKPGGQLEADLDGFRRLFRRLCAIAHGDLLLDGNGVVAPSKETLAITNRGEARGPGVPAGWLRTRVVHWA